MAPGAAGALAVAAAGAVAVEAAAVRAVVRAASVFFFCRRVPRFCGIEFSTVEGYWFIILADYHAQLEVAGISMYVKGLVEIWIL